MTYEGIDNPDRRGTDHMASDNNRNPVILRRKERNFIERYRPSRFSVLLYDPLYLQPMVVAQEG